MKRPIKNGYVMDVLLCRSFFPAKRKTLRWAKRRVNKDDRRHTQCAAAAELTRMRAEDGAVRTDLATRSIDAMVAHIDEALAEPREPFAWMPVLRQHGDAEVSGPRGWHRYSAAELAEIMAAHAMERDRRIAALQQCATVGPACGETTYPDPATVAEYAWQARTPDRMIGGSHA